MKARLIKNDSGKFQILYSDGTLANCTNERLYNFLCNFKNSDKFYGQDGTWKSDVLPDMAIYPGTTCAIISDDHNLLIMDFTPFSDLMNARAFDNMNLISAAEYGALHNRSAEIIKVFCRDGRLPGAKRIGGVWLIPADAAYPIAPDDRREYLVGQGKNKKS